MTKNTNQTLGQSRTFPEEPTDLEEPNDPNNKKKGVSHFYLNSDEEAEYMAYKPHRPELVSWANLKFKDNFAIKEYKDSLYRGLLDKGNKRTGKGVITYNSGRIFEGEWWDDKRHGLGFEIFHTGNSYEGEYVKGKVHGQGRYTWATGEFYDGEWVLGYKEGHGHWHGINGDEYIG